jgi:hypothetical protein
MIFCARATRGRGLPSLDARTLDNRQAAHPSLQKEWIEYCCLDPHQQSKPVIDLFAPEKVESSCFSLCASRLVRIPHRTNAIPHDYATTD